MSRIVSGREPCEETAEALVASAAGWYSGGIDWEEYKTMTELYEEYDAWERETLVDELLCYGTADLYQVLASDPTLIDEDSYPSGELLDRYEWHRNNDDDEVPDVQALIIAGLWLRITDAFQKGLSEEIDRRKKAGLYVPADD